MFENYVELGHAIVQQAAEDYLELKESIDELSSQGCLNYSEQAERRHLRYKLRKIRDFFESDWYKELCNVDGKKMIEMLDEEFEKRRLAEYET